MCTSNTRAAMLIVLPMALFAPLAVACSVRGAIDTPAGADDGGSTQDSEPNPDGRVNAPDSGTDNADAGESVTDGGPQATLQQGQVRGVVDGQTWSFRGVPYAAPPVGALRWTEPAPVAGWTGVRDATQFASECLQRPTSSDGGVTIAGDEDCLYLNVWTPAPIASGRPVMVFIPGGGFCTGAGSDQLYDSADLATHTGAVVVTINYRLGALGFLAHPALSAEVTPNGSGNYGILDQIAALRWVRANIAAFGGDAARVTIFGESAGATSAATLVASPLAAGLFDAAIFESGFVQFAYSTLAVAEAAGQTIAGTLGCGTGSDVTGCMRGLSAKAIIAGTADTDETILTHFDLGNYAFHPVVDDHLLTDQPKALLANGAYNHVPILLGNNALEAGAFAKDGTIPNVATDGDYRAAMSQIFGANAAAILAEYPAGNGVSPFDAYLSALTDGGFVCPTRSTARALLGNAGQPVYRYLFTDTLRGPRSIYGSMHGLELDFLFRTLGRDGYQVDAEDETVSTTLQTDWGAFAKSGAPNGSMSTPWPLNDLASDSYMEIGPTTQAQQGLHTSMCDFWDTLGYY